MQRTNLSISKKFPKCFLGGYWVWLLRTYQVGNIVYPFFSFLFSFLFFLFKRFSSLLFNLMVKFTFLPSYSVMRPSCLTPIDTDSHRRHQLAPSIISVHSQSSRTFHFVNLNCSRSRLVLHLQSSPNTFVSFIHQNLFQLFPETNITKFYIR